MLARQYRFHGYSSLKFVYGRGSMVRSKYFGLKHKANPRRENSRLAVVVTKKISKKATERNRLRRRVYENVRLHWPMIKPGQDLVMTVFDQSANELTAGELNKCVVELLVKADLYKK